MTEWPDKIGRAMVAKLSDEGSIKYISDCIPYLFEERTRPYNMFFCINTATVNTRWSRKWLGHNVMQKIFARKLVMI